MENTATNNTAVKNTTTETPVEVNVEETTLGDALNNRSYLLKEKKNAMEELTNASTTTHDKESPPNGEERQIDINRAKELLEVYIKLVKEIDELVKRIDRTNRDSTINVPGQGNLSIHEAVTLRESIISREKNLRSLAKTIQQSSNPRRGYGSEDSKTVHNLDPRDLKKQADQLAKEARNLNNLLQKANHHTLLLP